MNTEIVLAIILAVFVFLKNLSGGSCRKCRRLTAVFVLIFGVLMMTGVSAQTLKFDAALEQDFKAATNGDESASKRAMERAEKILEVNPKDAETLVWSGSLTLMNSGNAFKSGNFAEGGALWQKGLQRMESAVQTNPENVNIRLVRGTTLLSAARNFPDPAVAKSLRATGIVDYEKVLTITGDKFKQLPERERQQVLFGLGSAYDKTNDKIKAREFYARLVNESDAPSQMRSIAQKWLAENK